MSAGNHAAFHLRRLELIRDRLDDGEREMRERIAAAAAAGLNRVAIAEAAGVSVPTVYRIAQAARAEVQR